MDNLKIAAFICFIIFELAILYYLQGYMYQKTIEAERYAPLIEAGKICIELVEKNPYDPVPFCDTKLKDILLKRSINITLPGVVPNLEVFNNGNK